MENQVSVMWSISSLLSLSKPRLYWRPRMSEEVEHGTKCYLKPLKSRFVGQHYSLQVADIGESYYGKGMRVCPYDLPHNAGWFWSLRSLFTSLPYSYLHKQHVEKPDKYDIPHYINSLLHCNSLNSMSLWLKKLCLPTFFCHPLVSNEFSSAVYITQVHC